ncbi:MULTISPECIES: nitrite/sulfite reductase [unclassified Hyphomonas]|jgi:sulfite reductase (NADPH) hemoprotein beta-component|uniref:nitrite/sulfite reductase n=1 Tax=unclassified Hyphomonas TaxID=2630699 RepID=UPI000458D2A9|nr:MULTISPECIES: nitrite/sulfite reductase [unclassified Hyphomonas]KCZ45310.1 sulfite reductase [Hyphomonas sp. CY54-11-8]RAN40597.1 sulfite reductase [Hyphomonas sp. GM-8P]
MYRYDEFDARIVKDRVEQFRGQVNRRLSGELLEDEFKPLRLQNGVYLQLHAYMLRVAIPYGQLNGAKLRRLAEVSTKYDRGYGHFTTRQNIQYNWVALKDIPDALNDLAEVEMHAIQTSGNCIRNVTSDHFAGAAADEVMDPRPWCEIIRQWSTFHPEFAFLPRKFKFAVTAAAADRAAIAVHDIGLRIVKRGEQVGFEVYVGGGQGRTPLLAALVNDFVPEAELLDYVEAIMRVYNRYGRRDNKYKARIKILVAELGPEEFTRQVEAEYAAQRPHEKIDLPQAEIDRIHAYFAPPAFDAEDGTDAFEAAKAAEPDFAQWAEVNLHPHKQAGHASVTVSLKPIGGAAGDATDLQMEIVAGLAERYAYDDIRVSHAQNLVLPHVPVKHLYAIWQALDAAGLATPNESLITDLIVCPGLDYCNLANARSIPIGQAVQEVFADPKYQREIGRLHINISGCINACGHHHVGHIGILGVDRKGEEFYQISLGGRADEKAAIGAIAGPALKGEDVPGAVKRIIDAYMALRTSPDELFIDTLERVGADPFKEALYATA